MRDAMPAASRWSCFDHAAVCPLCGPATAAIEAWLEQAAGDAGTSWSRWRATVETLRESAARLVGADPDEIAVVRNTTEGIGLVAEGYRWRDGDNVVLPAGEFPSNLYPWLNLADRGVEVRTLPFARDHVDPAEIDRACDDRTRVVAVSWVGFRTGYRIDLDAVAEIAHRHGALLFVDAIQGLGAFPIDVRATGIDFLAADGHKWLLAPEGAGILYVRRECLELLRPLGLGWNSVRHAGEFTNTELDVKPTASRYEGGSYNMAGIAALAAAVEWLSGFGIDVIGRRILELTDRLCERLEKSGAEVISVRDGERRSGIVSFAVPGREPRQVRRECHDRGVVINCRDGLLRASPHAYVNDDDIERLVAVLS